MLCDDVNGEGVYNNLAFNLRTDDELKIMGGLSGISGATVFSAYPIIVD